MIALAECTTIRVKCGIPWQVNPNGWPCQGPLHVTPPIGIISLEAIALGSIALGAISVGANSIGTKFHWEKLHWNKISRAPRAMAGLHSWRRRHPVCLAASDLAPTASCLSGCLIGAFSHPWLETLSGSQPQVQLRRGRHWLFQHAPLHRELALRMVP